MLIIHHRVFDRWLPPGGHHEGSALLIESALREAEEETGIRHAIPHGWHVLHDAPFDIDIHPIGARQSRGEAAHRYHDLLCVFSADAGLPLNAQLSEVSAARWIAANDFSALPGLRFSRLSEKLSLLL